MKLNRKRRKTNYSNQKGITLIALVITIVVLLILAGVSINAIFSENGIINRAKEAQNKMSQAVENDLKEINELSNYLNEIMNNNDRGNTGGDTPTQPVTKLLITDASLKSNDRTTESQTVIAQDIKGNQVVVPGGFKIADDSGISVEQGIVIQDGSGNQFVWIPVSNINADGSNKIKKDDDSEVEITLGRYTFKREQNSETGLYEDGTSTLVQKGSEYDQTTVAQATSDPKTLDTKYRARSHFYELSDSRTSNEKDDLTGTNTTAKNLQAFIEKTNTNKGFYIARYEASYRSGYNASGSTTAEKYGNAKPLSKVSTASSESSMNYVEGTLWNFITQPQAAIVSQNMYKDNSYVESDLVNSYAWDTAIVYIQAMGNSNYANADRGTNTTLMNTGATGDEKCKIFDMAGNILEWTTEYSIYTNSSNAYSCVGRGSDYNHSFRYTSYNTRNYPTDKSCYISFRTTFYVK